MATHMDCEKTTLDACDDCGEPLSPVIGVMPLPVGWRQIWEHKGKLVVDHVVGLAIRADGSVLRLTSFGSDQPGASQFCAVDDEDEQAEGATVVSPGVVLTDEKVRELLAGEVAKSAKRAQEARDSETKKEAAKKDE